MKQYKFKQPKKAIIPAAGFGTRFLPYTKASPKEMMPILDKPVIQHIVEDLVSAGIEDIIIVTSIEKPSIMAHFSVNKALEKKLTGKKGKEAFLKAIQDIPELADFSFVNQSDGTYGNARPVIDAMDLLTPGEPFIVFSADDIFKTEPGKPTRAQQLLAAYNKTGKTTISLYKVTKKDTEKYGIAMPGKEIEPGLVQVKDVLEKPGPEKAPSLWASLMGYILTPEILPILKEEKCLDPAGEVSLPVAINELAQKDEVYGLVLDATYHDTGNQLKYLLAVMDFALSDERFEADVRKYLEKRL